MSLVCEQTRRKRRTLPHTTRTPASHLPGHLPAMAMRSALLGAASAMLPLRPLMQLAPSVGAALQMSSAAKVPSLYQQLGGEGPVRRTPVRLRPERSTEFYSLPKVGELRRVLTTWRRLITVYARLSRRLGRGPAWALLAPVLSRIANWLRFPFPYRRLTQLRR